MRIVIRPQVRSVLVRSSRWSGPRVVASIVPERGVRHGCRLRDFDHRRLRRAGQLMRRRTALALLAGTALPAQAQPAKRMPIVGFLHPGLQARGSMTMDALRRDMLEQGAI